MGRAPKPTATNPDSMAEELDLWRTDPRWLAELNGKTSLQGGSYHYIATDHLDTNQNGYKS